MPAVLAPGYQLCVFCTYTLFIPATRVAACVPPGAQLDAPPDLNRILPGPRLVDAARMAREDGYDIEINNAVCGVYADMIFGGNSVCTAHVWMAVDQARGTFRW